jgi:hypothetical protein
MTGLRQSGCAGLVPNGANIDGGCNANRLSWYRHLLHMMKLPNHRSEEVLMWRRGSASPENLSVLRGLEAGTPGPPMDIQYVGETVGCRLGLELRGGLCPVHSNSAAVWRRCY